MRNKAPVITAIVLGILALLAVRAYVNRVQQDAEAKLKGKKIVAAAVDIKEGTELTLSQVIPKEVPEQFIPPQAVKGSDELKQILGRKVRFAIKTGQMILWTDLESDKHGGLATVIAADERAFTINISKGTKNGLLQPNDHVDIICSFAVPKSTAQAAMAQAGRPQTSAATWREVPSMVNVVLLQNVTVIAIGEAFGGGPASAFGRGAGGDSVTVSVTLPEAQLLMFAEQQGELGVALRREGNLDTLPRDKLPRVTFDEMEKLMGDLDQQRKHRIVQIMKGKTVEEVQVGD
jgi:Flp pilus assembly protein CpaB